jgi:hypothetical protein
MLCREIIAVYCENNTNTYVHCVDKNAEIFNDKTSGAYSAL